MKVIVGLVGPKGSGKGLFAKVLENVAGQASVAHVRFTDLLKETLELWNLEATRANLQKLAVVMDQGFGKGTLSRAIANRLKHVAADIVVLESLRWDSDVELLRSFPKNVLVYITADVETRYARLKARGEKAGESTASLEQFMLEEQVPNEIHISRIGEDADARIDNEGDMEAYRAKIREIYISKIIPLTIG